MASLCKSHFLQQLYRKIDGAVLRSQNEHNLDCLITFQTETVLQRFMLRFDQLQLDCNDHLFIYDGAHATGVYKVCCRPICLFIHHSIISINLGYFRPTCRVGTRVRASALSQHEPTLSRSNTLQMVGVQRRADFISSSPHSKIKVNPI